MQRETGVTRSKMSLHTGRTLALAAAATLCACTVVGLREVPISDRSEPVRTSSAPAASPDARTPPALVREAKEGAYTVQRGDTLYSIALAFGQDWRDIARWNQLEDPTKLRVGQNLRVTASPGDAGAVAGVTPVVVTGSIESRPLDAAPPVSVPPPPASVKPATAPAAAESRTPAIDPGSPWSWPVPGKVIEAFNETRNKGIDIAGKEGDPVLAANDGQVVYSGNSLRGYGNLVIVKHNDDYISAYAHNKQILVQQGQTVKRGQRIAELGDTGTDTPKLHFEIRRQGKPVDPVKYLPARP
jgi:lipoprotein NlpD